MSKNCAICGKGTVFGNAVSHADNKTRRMWKPNTQRVRVVVGGGVVTKSVCTRCLRSGKVQRAL